MRTEYANNPQSGAGHGFLILTGLPDDPGARPRLTFSLQRSSDRRYLGPGGWLPLQEFIAPDAAEKTPEGVRLAVGPAVVDHLVMDQTYRLVIKMPSGRQFGTVLRITAKDSGIIYSDAPLSGPEPPAAPPKPDYSPAIAPSQAVLSGPAPAVAPGSAPMAAPAQPEPDRPKAVRKPEPAAAPVVVSRPAPARKETPDPGPVENDPAFVLVNDDPEPRKALRTDRSVPARPARPGSSDQHQTGFTFVRAPEPPPAPETARQDRDKPAKPAGQPSPAFIFVKPAVPKPEKSGPAPSRRKITPAGVLTILLIVLFALAMAAYLFGKIFL